MGRYLLLLCLFLFAGCAYVNVDMRPGPGPLQEHLVEGEGRAKIVLVDLSGILSLGPMGVERFSSEPSLVPRLKEEMQRAAADEDVAALVVRIDSPGGSVTASDILYHELRSFGRRQGLPVVACIMDKALSGGYYAALGADWIVSHPTAVVGGVGVVTFKFDISDLLESLGVQVGVVKSGPQKDFWSPLRQSTAQEEARMQAMIDRLHERFLRLVQEHRYLKPRVLKQVGKGGIFGAAPARDLGLVDQVGYLEDAFAAARELAEVSEARVVIYRRPRKFAGSIYAGRVPELQALSAVGRGAAEMLSPTFRYQYIP